MGRFGVGLKLFIMKVLGFLIFLILLGVLNLLNYYVSNDLLMNVVFFLNGSVFLIAFFSLLFLFGDIFSVMPFPFNLPAPLLEGLAGIFLVRFIFNVLSLVNDFTNIGIDFEWLYIIVASIVFVLAIVIGYVKILSNTSKNRNKSESRRTRR